MAPSNVNSSNIVPIEKIIVEENDNNKNGHDENNNSPRGAKTACQTNSLLNI